MFKLVYLIIREQVVGHRNTHHLRVKAYSWNKDRLNLMIWSPRSNTFWNQFLHTCPRPISTRFCPYHTLIVFIRLILVPRPFILLQYFFDFDPHSDYDFCWLKNDFDHFANTCTVITVIENLCIELCITKYLIYETINMTIVSVWRS